MWVPEDFTTTGTAADGVNLVLISDWSFHALAPSLFLLNVRPVGKLTGRPEIRPGML